MECVVHGDWCQSNDVGIAGVAQYTVLSWIESKEHWELVVCLSYGVKLKPSTQRKLKGSKDSWQQRSLTPWSRMALF